MKTFVTRHLLLLMLLGFTALYLNNAWSQNEQPDATKPKRGAWQPEQQNRSAYRDIVDFNIFLADRRRLAEQVDRERNPPAPSDPQPVATEPEAEDSPPDPDTLWRLTGISRDRDKTIAFIEHVETGELARISKPMSFSLGEITTIGYEGIIYVVDDKERMIRVGESLIGQRVTPTASSTSTTDGTAEEGENKPTSGSAADRLRQLRERREREQGNAS